MNKLEKLRCLIIDNTETALKYLKKGKEFKNREIKSILDLIYQYKNCKGHWSSTILLRGSQDQECICEQQDSILEPTGYGYLYNHWQLVENIPETYPIEYGLLYNWYAATDVRNICTDGWHIPSKTDRETLIAFLGGQTIAGGKLKEVGITHWNSPNTGATNEVGFNARGSGTRDWQAGNFNNLKTSFNMWLSTSVDGAPELAWMESMIYNLASSDNLAQSYYYKTTGLALRPVKDSTILTHGETGTYTGNDGKVYRTICIGTQEWLADNIAETKFRNGDYIHGYEGSIYTPISDVDWAALTTAGVCCYNDDTDNI